MSLKDDWEANARAFAAWAPAAQQVLAARTALPARARAKGLS
jgi:hypothetical protein